MKFEFRSLSFFLAWSIMEGNRSTLDKLIISFDFLDIFLFLCSIRGLIHLFKVFCLMNVFEFVYLISLRNWPRVNNDLVLKDHCFDFRCFEQFVWFFFLFEWQLYNCKNKIKLSGNQCLYRSGPSRNTRPTLESY